MRFFDCLLKPAANENLLVIGTLLLMSASCKPSNTKQVSNTSGYIDRDNKARGHSVSVCWSYAPIPLEEFSPFEVALHSLPQIVTDRNIVAAAQEKIRSTVTDQYRQAGIEITGWGDCGRDNADISLVFLKDETYSRSFGFGKDSKRIGLGTHHKCAVDYMSAASNCIGSVALHEFGHSLGLHHEMNRRDNADCPYDQMDGLGESDVIQIGDFDMQSIMNYCHIFSANKQNLPRNLSSGDLATLRMLYDENPIILRPQSEPDRISDLHDLDISFGPENLSQLKFKVGIFRQIDCKTEQGYQLLNPMPTRFTFEHIRSFVDQDLKPAVPIQFCFLGGTSDGQWQPYDRYTGILTEQIEEPIRIKSLVETTKPGSSFPEFDLEVEPTTAKVYSVDFRFQAFGVENSRTFQAFVTEANRYRLFGSALVGSQTDLPPENIDKIEISYQRLKKIEGSLFDSLGLGDHDTRTYQINQAGFYTSDEHISPVRKILFHSRRKTTNLAEWVNLSNLKHTQFLNVHTNKHLNVMNLENGPEDYGSFIVPVCEGLQCTKFSLIKASGNRPDYNLDFILPGQEFYIVGPHNTKLSLVNGSNQSNLLVHSTKLCSDAPDQCPEKNLFYFEMAEGSRLAFGSKVYIKHKEQIGKAVTRIRTLGMDDDGKPEFTSELSKAVWKLELNSGPYSNKLYSGFACHMIESATRGPMVCPPGFTINPSGRCAGAIAPQRQPGYSSWPRVERSNNQYITDPAPINLYCLNASGGLRTLQTSVCGRYQRLPIENNWHSGTITGDSTLYQWTNEAGTSWNLTLDGLTGILTTGDDNPYKDQAQSQFELVYELNSDQDIQVSGFRFLSEFYKRTEKQSCF